MKVATRKQCSALAVAALCVVLSACVSDRKGEHVDEFFGKWRQAAEEARARWVSAAEASEPEGPGDEAASPAAASTGESGRPLPDRPISLSLQNVDLSAFFVAIGQLADVVVLARPDIVKTSKTDEEMGSISISVEDVPWDELFLGVLQTYGLRHRWEGEKILRVMTLEDMKRDMELGTFAREQEQEEKERLRAKAPLETRVIRINYLNLDDDDETLRLKNTLAGVLRAESADEAVADPVDAVQPSRPEGSVNIHDNIVIVRGTAGQIEVVLDVLDELDKPTEQVLIEANIVEATKDTARKLGFQWGGLLKVGDNWITPGSNTGDVLGNTLDTAVNPLTGTVANFPASLGVGDDPSGMTLGFVSEKVGKYLLDVQLSALEEDGKLNILSSPSIATMDNETAFIESGEEVPYQIVTGTGDNRDTTTEWKKAVLRLEVTPHIIGPRTLKLKISTNKDELDFSRATDTNPNPIVITKKAETHLVLRDGQTTVIGGLSKQLSDMSESGVPWLKDIPLLGYLFKSRGTSTDMEEVLIFITPNILRSGAAAPSRPPQAGD